MNSVSAKEAEFDERVLQIARDADGFECYRSAHAARLAQLADPLAHTFNLASHDRYSLRQAALVHDVGELVMNREYISASRNLRESERIDVQRHTIIGEQEAAKRGLSRAVQLLVRWHHEWWNGAGYPDALEREQIPLAARILRVCDTFCAMTAVRPYRQAISEAEAKKYLTEWAGIEFDPRIVKTFLALGELEEIRFFADQRQTQTAEQFSPLPLLPPDNSVNNSVNNNERFVVNNSAEAAEDSAAETAAEERKSEPEKSEQEMFFVGDEQFIREEEEKEAEQFVADEKAPTADKEINVRDR